MCSAPLLCLEAEIPDVKHSMETLQENGNAALFQHAHLLLETNLLRQSREMKQVLNKQILSFAKHCRFQYDPDSQKWSLGITSESPGRLQAWWQDQLESMNCLVPGLGIERSGLRFHKKGAEIHVLSRNVSALPKFNQLIDKEEKALLVYKTANNKPMSVHVNEQGINITGTQKTSQEYQARTLDKAVLEAIPQEIFAWTMFNLNNGNRAQVKFLLAQASDIVQVAASKELRDILNTIVSDYNGQVFLGLSAANHGFELVLMCDEVPLVKTLRASVQAANEKEAKTLFHSSGGQRVVFAHNLRTAEILSFDRSNNFPQKLPERIRDQQNLEAAGYVNTLILAQQYYDALPMLRHYSDHVGTQELNMLRSSLRDMVPHFKSMVFTAVRENEEIDIRIDGAGNSLVLATGLSLCYRYAATEQKDASQYIMKAYEQITLARQQGGLWPVHLARQTNGRLFDCCYLKPEEADDFDLPVLIENPARHAGLGSYVVLSNGKTSFVQGRRLWNKALQIKERSEGSYWMDWQSEHHVLMALQDVSRQVSLEAQQMRQIFLQLDR